MVDCFIADVLEKAEPDWREFVVKGVSDVDDARTICLMPGGGHLTLFEREISKGEREVRLRRAIRAFLDDARKVYDYILIDSAPGLSVLTECWLREADFYIAPTKPDFICVRGLQFLDEFRQRDLSIGFADSLGVVVNMKDPNSEADEQFDRWLRQDAATGASSRRSCARTRCSRPPASVRARAPIGPSIRVTSVGACAT